MRKLATRRLALEPLVRGHAPEMFEALSDPVLYRYIDEEPPESLAALAERYARLESRRSGDGHERWLNWALRETASGKLIGFVQATVRPDASALIAYVVAPPRWGQGFAREATEAMLEELVSGYGVARLLATVDPRNAPSLALLRALGFEDRKSINGDRVFERTG